MTKRDYENTTHSMRELLEKWRKENLHAKNDSTLKRKLPLSSQQALGDYGENIVSFECKK